MIFFLLLISVLLAVALMFVYGSYYRAQKQVDEEIDLRIQQELKYEDLKAKEIQTRLQLSKYVDAYKKERGKWAKAFEDQKARIVRLHKWSKVADADEKAAELVREAERKYREILKSAESKRQSILYETELKVRNEITGAENKVNLILRNGNLDIANLNSLIKARREEADGIISAAKALGEKVYADAQKRLLGLQEEHRETLNILKAIENKIKGYGIEYFVPGVSLLDELADDYSHKDAVTSLKFARNRVREMMRNIKAADCNYSEEIKRFQAIFFVVDAFNSKVENILSRVKHDNFGKLSQEIRDAAIIANHNGQPFGNTRILFPYMNARLEELKWATVVHELRLREREEQRAIREQMREEAKVRREIEKAKKKAEQEEMIAKKAYDEALKKFAEMSEEQKRLHAKEIEAMQERVRLAEENKRTISMAEQTKVGHVYVISNLGAFGENVFKIGMTRRLDPLDRISELSSASVPFPFDVHAMIHTENAPELENRLHKMFRMNQMNKTNVRKEFFRVDLDAVKKLVESLGIEAHWTLLSEAAQYRETLRIEERIKTDDEYRTQWEDRQDHLEAMESEIVEDEEEEIF